jgi:hypothetical protein
MGGKDVVHIRQLENSNLQPAEVQKLLKEYADKRFSEDVNGSFLSNPAEISGKLKVHKILMSTLLSLSCDNIISVVKVIIRCITMVSNS